MKHLLRFNESHVSELLKVKDQFLNYLNGNMKSHWIKRDIVTYALYQSFCKEYGYTHDETFSDKYPKLFTKQTLQKWFDEWREYELIKIDKVDSKKIKNLRFPYKERKNH